MGVVLQGDLVERIVNGKRGWLSPMQGLAVLRVAGAWCNVKIESRRGLLVFLHQKYNTTHVVVARPRPRNESYRGGRLTVPE